MLLLMTFLFYSRSIGSCKYQSMHFQQFKAIRYINKKINNKILFYIYTRDRIRTTNNMLGDCYAAAVVEQLSKKELMALDAAAYQVKYIN